MRKTAEKRNTSSAVDITLILLGILVTPVLLASSSLGSALNLQQLIPVIIVASLILAVLAMTNIFIGEQARLPTYSIVKFAFGKQGAIAINIIMAISLFGWITVTANMFGHTLQDLLLQQFNLLIPLPILVAFGCIIFVSSTAFGFEILGKVSKWAIPVIVILMLYMLWLTLGYDRLQFGEKLSTLSFGAAVSSVVGTIIVLVATSPDFGSFIHDKKHAIIAGFLTFALVYPLLYLMGAIPSLVTSNTSLIGAMAIIGTTLPAFIILIFACVTGNAGNIFQGTLVFSTLFTQFSKKSITISLGIGAAIVGSFDIMAWFIPFLLFLGIVMPPISGIYIADYFYYRRKGYDQNLLESEKPVKYGTFIVWLLGSLVGFMTVNSIFALTGISSLDSILFSSIGYFLLCYFKK